MISVNDYVSIHLYGWSNVTIQETINIPLNRR
ncbi:hypothetical protein EMIT0P2_10936 [Pseudomonas sp. IT-P2]